LRDLTEKAQDDKLKKEIGRLKQTAREKEAWSRNLEATKSRKKTLYGVLSIVFLVESRQRCC
ncbi:hypothetical protein, partial [Lactococcus petauri]|uniref:hypothetical protein n=1 Tax=Lactococcus petauri TaxID=1940789 RepID=UPI00254B97EA